MMKPHRCLIVALLFLAACSSPTPTPIVYPTATLIPPSTTTEIPTATPILPRPAPSATPLPGITTIAAPPCTATSTRVTSPTRTLTAIALLPTWTVRTLLVAPGQPGRLYALLTDQPFSVVEAEKIRFVISDDFGTTWTEFSGGVPVEAACLHDINLDYATRDALYASTCKGLYRWSGTAWQLVSSQETWMVAVVFKQSSIIWANNLKDRAAPVIRSSNGGKTWQSASDQLVHFNGIANLGIDPRDAQTLYAIIMPQYAGSYLRRGTPNGQWVTMPTPMDNAQIDVGMSIDGAIGDLYVTANNSRTARWGVWRSRNPNITDVNSVKWEPVYEFESQLWATMLASGWSPQGLALYVNLRDYNSAKTTLMSSLDAGKTWNAIMIR